ncbi:hypothetical protein RRG08_047928 [Elysia crispata]|uniref:Uncharacterized protein n=1 Tax=Elysia crispata TaxID=231223 RepID=A0AAE1DIF0_9GAST|nr:hypothetical protein RRG08_047928 [Elysia crispata]
MVLVGESKHLKAGNFHFPRIRAKTKCEFTATSTTKDPLLNDIFKPRIGKSDDATAQARIRSLCASIDNSTLYRLN